MITLNSLVNPIIYCARIRQFRVALIQLLIRKDAGKAENIERRFFGRVNRVAPENLESRLSGNLRGKGVGELGEQVEQAGF